MIRCIVTVGLCEIMPKSYSSGGNFHPKFNARVHWKKGLRYDQPCRSLCTPGSCWWTVMSRGLGTVDCPCRKLDPTADHYNTCPRRLAKQIESLDTKYRWFDCWSGCLQNSGLLNTNAFSKVFVFGVIKNASIDPFHTTVSAAFWNVHTDTIENA